MSAIECKIRVIEDKDPATAAMLKELEISPKKEDRKVAYYETLINTRVLVNAQMVVKTPVPTIAIQWLGHVPIHLKYDDEVWDKIQAVLNT